MRAFPLRPLLLLLPLLSLCGVGVRGDPAPDLRISIGSTANASAGRLVHQTRDAQCYLDDACLDTRVSGALTRTFVVLHINISNVGDAPFDMGAPPDSTADNSTFWWYSTCRQLWSGVHITTELLLADGSFTVVQSAYGVPRVAFVLHDEVCVPPTSGQPVFTPSSTQRGLSVNCSASQRDCSTDCQWVELTSVPGGDYTVRATLNTSGTGILESRYDNNVAYLNITVPVAADKPALESCHEGAAVWASVLTSALGICYCLCVCLCSVAVALWAGRAVAGTRGGGGGGETEPLMQEGRPPGGGAESAAPRRYMYERARQPVHKTL
jgi:hypothetical protein